MNLRANKGKGDVNLLQMQIMRIVDTWAREKKTPIPHRFILTELKTDGVIELTAKAALRVLITKGYLRRAVMMSKRTFYVMLRTI